MNAVARLIKAKTISFSEELLSNYSKLKLTETDVVTLIHLNRQLDKNNNLLSINELCSKMTLTEEQLSTVLINLVKKGYLELLIDDGCEIFKLDGAYEALADVINNEETVNQFQNREDLLSQIVLYIETTYVKVCTPNDLMIVNHWLDLGYSFEEIKIAVLDSLKAKKTHLKYADAILANRKNKTERTTVTYDEDLKRMLDEMYVKK